MSKLCVIFPDQLHSGLTAFKHIDKQNDWIFLGEMHQALLPVKQHKKKLVFMLASLRHFVKALEDKGFQVIHPSINDKKCHQPYHQALAPWVIQHKIETILCTKPNDYALHEETLSWEKILKVPCEHYANNHFLCSDDTFQSWAKGKKSLLMESFYRLMRKQHDILMDGDKPTGDQWNFDHDNRKKIPKDLSIPKPCHSQPDAITKQAIKDVSEHFSDHFGDIEPFIFATSRQGALHHLRYFIENNLPHFGDYQDAMATGEPWLFHAHIGLYLNNGMLTPLEVVQATETAYLHKKAPINATEGFIRQILGWREYVRGIYWLKMPEYENLNFLKAKRKLPALYWGKNTNMHCLRECVDNTKTNAYAHHIQRLMVLGNFALIAGLNPKEVNEWYWLVYADAYQWVELPNVSGMTLFADGGVLGSKPYAASGAYINKMSNYCKNCHYNVKEKLGEQACPFNYLYWDFLLRNQATLEKNPRLALAYNHIRKKSPEDIKAITQQSKHFLDQLD